MFSSRDFKFEGRHKLSQNQLRHVLNQEVTGTRNSVPLGLIGQFLFRLMMEAPCSRGFANFADFVKCADLVVALSSARIRCKHGSRISNANLISVSNSPGGPYVSVTYLVRYGCSERCRAKKALRSGQGHHCAQPDWRITTRERREKENAGYSRNSPRYRPESRQIRVPRSLLLLPRVDAFLPDKNRRQPGGPSQTLSDDEL